MELSEESREAQLKHAESLKGFEAQQRARSIIVPTAIEDVKANSLRKKPNVIDYLYVPKVRANLIDNDFDCFEGWDVLPNMEIMITAVFDPAQITVKDQQQLC